MQTAISKEELLGDLGLSKNDAKVYLTLLKEGPSIITKIAKKSNIHRANVYEALARLKAKGLVSEKAVELKKVFNAADPSTLLTLIQEKELRIKAALPNFMMDFNCSSKNNTVEVYENVAALRNIFTSFLDIKKDIYVFGIPKNAVKHVGEHFQNAFHNKRAVQKQWMYHIYNYDAMERIKFLNTLPYTKARSMGNEFNSPVYTIICGNQVIFVSVRPEDAAHTIIQIRNKEMAEVYTKYFNILWEQSR